jgi:peptide chain release factor subunit 1
MPTREQIDRIVQFGGDGLPVVSLYVGVEPDRSPQHDGDLPSRMNSLLAPVRALGKDRWLEHDARLSIRGDLERLARAATEERRKPGMMALFSCSGRGFFEEVSLPRSLRDGVMLDGTPWVRPMLAVLEGHQRMCIVIADDSTAQVWELHLREIREVRWFRDPVLRKPDVAYGMAEHRVRNKGEELAKRHYRRVAAELNDIYLARGFDLLAVGGHPHEVSRLVDGLAQELRDRIAGTLTLDASTATPTDVRRSAESIMDRHEREEDRGLVAEIVAAVAERRRAVLGVEQCLWAGTVAAIGTLAMRDGAAVPGVVCDQDGWMALSGATCPLCGQPIRPTVDVLDELVESVIHRGGSVRYVRTETALSRHTAGAILRFPLPPGPPT